MNEQITTIAYLVAAVLFVFALKRMASPKTARLGNLLGAVGMLIAIACTLAARSGVTGPAVRGAGWGMIRRQVRLTRGVEFVRGGVDGACGTCETEGAAGWLP